MKRFENKVVIVTGASRNTGVEIADLFIREGAKVCTSGSTLNSTQNGANELRSRGLDGFISIPCDIGNDDEVKALFAKVMNTFGRVDILVNNACDQGIGRTFEELTSDEFFKVIKTNLLGCFQMCQNAVKIMLKQESKGVIVNLGSNVSMRAIKNRTAYVASKGGIDALTRSMAIDLAPKGIRINEVAPGYIYTQRWEVLSEDIKTRRRNNIPLRKEASGKDIADAVAFLASDAAKNICGERIVVDGGCSAQHMPTDIDF